MIKTNLVRGIIESTDNDPTNNHFSTAEVSTNHDQDFTDVKRYQQYGFHSHVVKADEDYGTEVIVYDNNNDRSIIAENDPRFRPTSTVEGSVELYTNKPLHNVILNPIRRAISFISGISSYKQNDDGLIELTNKIAKLELTVNGLQESIGSSSRTLKEDSIADIVGTSSVYINPSSYSVIADQINLLGVTKITDVIIEGGVIDGDVKMIKRGDNTIDTLENTMASIATENGGSTDISHLETKADSLAKKADSDTKDTDRYNQIIAGDAVIASDIVTTNSNVTNLDNTTTASINTINSNVTNLDNTTTASFNTTNSNVTAVNTLANIANTTANTAQGTANTANTTANSKTKTFRQNNTPIASTVGDIWINSSNNNLNKRWDGVAWVDTRDTSKDASIVTAQNSANTAQSTANTANTTANTAQNSANTAQGTANTAQGTANTAQGTANTANTTANTALTNANTAQTSADRVATFRQSVQPPTGASFGGDLWIDSDDGKNYRYDGSTWVYFRDTAKDSSITSAQNTANTANSTANAVSNKTIGFTRTWVSGTKYKYTFSADEVQAYGGFEAKGLGTVSGQPTTALFNWNSNTSYGVLARGTVTAGRFEMNMNGNGGSGVINSTHKVAVHGIGSAGNNVAIQGSANQANSFAGHFTCSDYSTTGIYIGHSNATYSTNPALYVNAVSINKYAIHAIGRVKVSGLVEAPTFIGALSGNATTCTTATNSGKLGNVSSGNYIHKVGGASTTGGIDSSGGFFSSTGVVYSAANKVGTISVKIGNKYYRLLAYKP